MIDSKLRSFLLSQTAISTVATGVYPVRLPQAQTGPSIVYQVDGGSGDLIAGGVGGVVSHSITLNVFGDSYATNRQLTQSLITLLHGFSGDMNGVHVTGSRLVAHINTFEEDQNLYRAILTFDIYTQ
jgi:hypothetical protein